MTLLLVLIYKIVFMPKFFSLSRVIQRVDELLRPAMEKTFWLKAEISSSRAKGGHFYCDLVETSSTGQLAAQVRCTIWSRDLTDIRHKFRKEGLSLELEDGLSIGILCRLQYHPIYGISLRGLDMDPAFVLGEMELKKRAIIESLQKKKLTELNANLPLDILPKRIGLITGEGTAAYEDFVNTLMSSHLGFEIFFSSATMQGPQTALSISKSLTLLSKLDLDLVVICRGGGSKVDLSWLDQEGLAEKVAHYPIPVWTGIGHEIDTSVLDFVSAKSFKTPTAVAEELVSIYTGMKQWVDQSRHNLMSSWSYRLKEAQQYLETSRQQLKSESQHLVRTEKENLKLSLEQLNSRVSFLLSEEKVSQKELAQNLYHSSKNFINELKNDLKYSRENLVRESLRQCKENRHTISQLKGRFVLEKYLNKIQIQNDQIELRHKRLTKGPIWSRLRTEENRLKQIASIFKNANPETQLERGYSLLKDESGAAITRTKKLKTGQKIYVQLKDGSLKATIDSTLEKPNN